MLVADHDALAATRCFITPSCVNYVGLKGIPHDVFLELGNGEKYLSRGYVPKVPITTTGLIVKVALTVTNLLHEVDLVVASTRYSASSC